MPNLNVVPDLNVIEILPALPSGDVRSGKFNDFVHIRRLRWRGVWWVGPPLFIRSLRRILGCSRRLRSMCKDITVVIECITLVASSVRENSTLLRTRILLAG